VTKVNISSNVFHGVQFPLVVGDRYFSIYTDDLGELTLDVFWWDESTARPVYEVQAGVPSIDGVTSNRTGILTFAKADGGFLFKFRPNPGQSQLFGLIPGSADTGLEVRCTDREVIARLDGKDLVTMSTGMISGYAIGIQIDENGSFSIGSNVLPPGMELVARV
jgi:hypothetical protein